jgi:hypothetical protein
VLEILMPNSHKELVIIGSGLAAFAATRAALEFKVPITIIDIGDLLPLSIQSDVLKIDRGTPSAVSSEMYAILSKDSLPSLNKRELPRKTLFGSKYFYKEDQLSNNAQIPFSEAMGGYSVAWGAAVLPPSLNDLPGINFDYQDLMNSMNKLGPYIRIPMLIDDLTPEFPNLSSDNAYCGPNNLSNSQTLLLENLRKLGRSTKNEKCLVGQSRVLTKKYGEDGCRYCGMCSFGCLYDAIFSSKIEIQKLQDAKQIEYLAGIRVTSIEQLERGVRINATNISNGKTIVFTSETVFVAAGAVNSTKIALKSLNLTQKQIKFSKTGGFVRPYFSIRKLGLDWPNQNTQANIFMEIMNIKISKYWIHSQISTPNEIVILGLGFFKKSFFQKLFSPFRNFLLKHLVLVMTNIHSGDGPFYAVKMEEIGATSRFVGSLEIPKSYLHHEKRIDRLIRRKLLTIALLPIPFSKKGVSNGPGYHIGCSLPMGGEGALSTNELGVLEPHRDVHFVDTSVLPCIPATTIGLFTMANSHRITSRALRAKGYESR